MFQRIRSYVRQGRPKASDPPWPFDQKKVFPRLINNFADDEEEPTSPPSISQSVFDEKSLPVSHPFRENIETIYLLDQEGSRKWINFQDLEDWQLNKDSLRELALQNIRDLYRTSFLRQEITPGVFAASILYDLESSLLLTEPNWFEDMVSPENVMAIAPCRDMLLFGDRSSPMARENICRALGLFWEDSVPSHRLTKTILIRDASHTSGWAFFPADQLLRSSS